MFALLLSLSFILGVLVGSFLNVVIYRFGTTLSMSHGRSQCLHCGKVLSWYELIPLFSYLFQKGKCQNCGSNISVQYPLVELSSAVLFALVFVRQYWLYTTVYSFYSHGLTYSVLFALFYFSIVSLLLVIAVYDMRHKIIPNTFVYWFIGLSVSKLILYLFLCLPFSLHLPAMAIVFSFPYVCDFLAPVIFFIPFWFLWFISKGTWMGFGDAKLAIGIGALLGFVSGLSAIVLGFWIGAVVCIILLSLQKLFPEQSQKIYGSLNMSSEVPLGPFLILGVFIVLFSHVDVLGITHYFTP